MLPSSTPFASNMSNIFIPCMSIVQVCFSLARPFPRCHAHYIMIYIIFTFWLHSCFLFPPQCTLWCIAVLFLSMTTRSQYVLLCLSHLLFHSFLLFLCQCCLPPFQDVKLIIGIPFNLF